MNILKIISSIIIIWIILKVKSFISGIKIKSTKPIINKKEKNRKKSVNIQDADYEDIE